MSLVSRNFFAPQYAQFENYITTSWSREPPSVPSTFLQVNEQLMELLKALDEEQMNQLLESIVRAPLDYVSYSHFESPQADAQRRRFEKYFEHSQFRPR